MKQRYSHSQSSRKLRYLRFFPYSCEKTQALTNTRLPCPSLFCSALNHSNADFSLLSLIKEQLCWWLMASLSRPLPWPLTVQGRSPYLRPWCSISDMHDTCWSRERELILINIHPASAYSSLPILLPLQGHICQHHGSKAQGSTYNPTLKECFHWAPLITSSPLNILINKINKDIKALIMFK